MVAIQSMGGCNRTRSVADIDEDSGYFVNRLPGEMEPVDEENGYFIVQVSNEEDQIVISAPISKFKICCGFTLGIFIGFVLFGLILVCLSISTPFIAF